jgi:heptosyltransferase-2
MKPKVLILQTAFLGDLLLSIPLVKRIRKRFPNHLITLVCRNGCGDIFRELSLVDQVFEVNKSCKPEYRQLIQDLKKQNYDYIFSPHYSFRTNWIVRGLKANFKVGFENFWNKFFLTHKIKRNLNLPDALRQLQLIAPFDKEVSLGIEEYLDKRMQIQTLDLNHLNPSQNRIPVPSFANMCLKSELSKHPQYEEILKAYQNTQHAVFLAPGSVWNTKKWTEEGYRKVAQSYSNVVLIGSPQERDLCDRICSGMKNVQNIAGRPSLFELFVILTKARLVICTDSGAMHMASVAGASTVAIFGPTVLEIGYQPWQDRALVVENKNLNCRPCGKHGPQKCPLGHHNCMKSISAEQVISAADKLLTP